MQKKFNTKSRRELLKDGAASLMPEWKEAARAMLAAELESCRVSDAADTEIIALPELPEAPKAPNPERFANEEARAVFRETIHAIVNSGADEARKWEAAYEAGQRLGADGRLTPEYRQAVAGHEKCLAEHAEAAKARKAQERTIRERHGLPRAQDASNAAAAEWGKLQVAVLAAPVHSQDDALAVLVAAVFEADWLTGVFDESSATRNALARLRPFLPASPSSLPKNWDIT